MTTRKPISVNIFSFEAHENNTKKIGLALIDLKDLQDFDQSNQELETMLKAKTPEEEQVNANDVDMEHPDDENEIEKASGSETSSSYEEEIIENFDQIPTQEILQNVDGQIPTQQEENVDATQNHSESSLFIAVEDSKTQEITPLLGYLDPEDASEISAIMPDPKLEVSAEDDAECREMLHELEDVDENSLEQSHKDAPVEPDSMTADESETRKSQQEKRNSRFVRSRPQFAKTSQRSYLNPVQGISISINISGLDENKTIRISKIQPSFNNANNNNSCFDNSQKDALPEEAQETPLMKTSVYQPPRKMECEKNDEKETSIYQPERKETMNDILSRIMQRNSFLLEKLDAMRRISDRKMKIINDEIMGVITEDSKTPVQV